MGLAMRVFSMTGCAPSGRDHSTAERSRLWPWFVAINCGFWVVMMLLNMGMSIALAPDRPANWPPALARSISGFLITAGLAGLFETTSVRRLGRPVRWLLLLVTTLVCLIGSVVLLEAFDTGLPVDWMGRSALGQLLPRIAAGILWCTGFLALDLLNELYAAEIRFARAETDAARREMRAAQLEASVLEKDVQRLQAQMNPHFLFNALNTVIAHKDRPDDVARVSQDLADFLRSALRESRPVEPFAAELRVLEKYVVLQQARFGQNLECRIVCDRAARNVLVPPMTVQPLLENAIAYGMKTSQMPLKVEVSARVERGWLEVVVANSGRWISPASSKSPGTGLRTIRKRLALLIGPEAVVDVVPPVAGDWAGVRVMIRLPAERAPESVLGATAPPVEAAT